jgi:hypothetical protein
LKSWLSSNQQGLALEIFKRPDAILVDRIGAALVLRPSGPCSSLIERYTVHGSKSGPVCVANRSLSMLLVASMNQRHPDVAFDAMAPNFAEQSCGQTPPGMYPRRVG